MAFNVLGLGERPPDLNFLRKNIPSFDKSFNFLPVTASDIR